MSSPSSSAFAEATDPPTMSVINKTDRRLSREQRGKGERTNAKYNS